MATLVSASYDFVILICSIKIFSLHNKYDF